MNGFAVGAVFVANPWGLLGLLALPVLVWLHRFRRDQRRREVSCLALWEGVAPLRDEGLKVRRLPWDAVLWLSLLAALLLALALADPRWQGDARRVDRLGVVVDSSASMSEDSAQKGLYRRLEALQRDYPEALFSVIANAPRERRIGSALLPAKALRATVESMAFDQPSRGLLQAVDLAQALLPESTPLVVISDRPAPAWAASHALHWQTVGQARANWGFVNAAWEAGETPFVVVRRFAPTPESAAAESVRVAWTSDNGLEGDVALPRIIAGEEHLLRLQPPAGATRLDLRLDLRLAGAADDPGFDNRLSLVAPRPRVLRLQVASESERLRRSWQRLAKALPVLSLADASRPPEALTLERSSPSPDLGVPLLQLLSPRDGDAVAWQRELISDRFEGLLAGADLHGLRWFAPVRDPGPGAVVLLRSPKTALVWLQGRRLLVNIDRRRSNLFEHVFWPVLVQNWVNALLDARGGFPARRSLRIGERLMLRRALDWPPGEQAPWWIAGRVYQGDRLDLGRLTQAGVFDWRLEDGANHTDSDDRQGQFSVFFVDAAESNLADRAGLDRAGAIDPSEPLSLEPQAASGDQPSSWIARLLSLLAMLCLFVAWLLLSKVSPSRSKFGL